MLAKESRFIERFKTHVAKAAQVQSRVKKLDKIEKIEPTAAASSRRRFDFRAPPRSGDDVVKLDGAEQGVRRRASSTTASTLLVRAQASAGRSWARTAPASRRCSR